MKRLIALQLMLALAGVSASVHACSLVPSMQAFEADQLAFSKRHAFPVALGVPAPIVKILSVKRASSDVVGSCDRFAVVELEISLPKSSTFDLSEVGFVFRAPPDKPQDPFLAFPNFPVVSKQTSGNRGVARFRFHLKDPVADRSKPFELKIEIFAINRGLQVGPSTVAVARHR